VKVGIVGVAHMHIESYVQCFNKLHIAIEGAFERNNDLLKEFCKHHHMTPFATLEALLSTNIDTVIICSENSYHCRYTLLAASYHKNVIVEKPIAISLNEADQMIEACKNEKVQLMISHPVRFSKPIQQLKHAVELNKLTNVRAINASNHGKIPGGWFMNKDLSGGGAIMDHTIHIADLVHWIFNLNIKSIFARTGKLDEQTGVDISGLLHITCTNGVIMSLDTSWNRPSSLPVWGDASLEISSDEGLTHVDGFGRKINFFSEKQKLAYLYYEEDMNLSMMRAFQKAVDEKAPSPVTGEDGKFALSVALLAYKSIATHSVVKVEE
jgi:predicted dehydrogenase